MTIRFRALLSSALFLCLPAAAQTQKHVAAPAAPKQDRQVVLQGDDLEYDSEGKTVTIAGHVEIVDEGRVLLADRVAYNQNSDTVTADGHVSVTTPRQCQLRQSFGADRSYARWCAKRFWRAHRQERKAGCAQRPTT